MKKRKRQWIDISFVLDLPKQYIVGLVSGDLILSLLYSCLKNFQLTLSTTIEIVIVRVK